MQQMKIRCHSREHADRVVAAARRMGYRVTADYKVDREMSWDTLQLHGNGSGSFWEFYQQDYPEYALYGDHLLPVSEGWIEWGGGVCPVVPDNRVEYIIKTGNQGGPIMAGELRWCHGVGQGDIIAYRLADRQQPAEDKAELTPCQQRGLRVGQWVWATKEADSTVDAPCWIRLMFDDGSEAPMFNESSEFVKPFVGLKNIDWSASIHDSKPDWTPGEKMTINKGDYILRSDIPDEAAYKAVVAELERRGFREYSGNGGLAGGVGWDILLMSDDGDVVWARSGCGEEERRIILSDILPKESQPPIPDEAIAKAAEAPVEWDGINLPPVGAVCKHPTGRGIVMLPPDVNGITIIRSTDSDSDGVYKRVAISGCRPIQSGRDKFIGDIMYQLPEDLRHNGCIYDALSWAYDAGYRKTENNNE